MSNEPLSSSPLPIRVLMVSFNTPPFHFAGAGNQAVLLSKAMIAQGLWVSLITSAGNCWQTPHDLGGGLTAVCLKEHPNKWLRFLFFQVMSLLWWLGNAHRFDVVHIHGCTHLTTLIWILLAKLWGKPSLMKVTCSGVDDYTGLKNYPILGPVATLITSGLTRWIAITPDIAADLRQNRVPEKKIIEIPNGIDCTLFAPLPDETQKQHLRENLALPTDATLLIYTGGINPRKNVQFLVERFAEVHSQLAKTQPNLMLVLAGPTKAKFRSYEDILLQRIEGLGLRERIVLTDELPHHQVAQYLQASDVFVFASLQEGMPSSPVEAMACGLPTVIQELPGLTDWLYDPAVTNETQESPAIVVPADAPAAFTKALVNLLNQRHRMTVMGQAAISRVKQHYDLTTIAQSYAETIYPKVLGRR